VSAFSDATKASCLGRPVSQIRRSRHSRPTIPLPKKEARRDYSTFQEPTSPAIASAPDTARTLRGVWIYTVDVGYIDDDDVLFVVDRVKDMVVTDGMNVCSRGRTRRTSCCAVWRSSLPSRPHHAEGPSARGPVRSRDRQQVGRQQVGAETALRTLPLPHSRLAKVAGCAGSITRRLEDGATAEAPGGRSPWLRRSKPRQRP
jgi:hypothetical protein